MKKNFRLPVCPYCGSRLNYAQSWVLRRRGEYICPKCGGLSNIVLDQKIRHAVFFTVLAAVTFFFLGLVSERFGIVGLCGILAAGAVFFFLSPLYVRLRRPASPSRRKPQAAETSQNKDTAEERYTD